MLTEPIQYIHFGSQFNFSQIDHDGIAFTAVDHISHDCESGI